jgi:hypothetical protein
LLVRIATFAKCVVSSIVSRWNLEFSKRTLTRCFDVKPFLNSLCIPLSHQTLRFRPVA